MSLECSAWWKNAVLISVEYLEGVGFFPLLICTCAPLEFVLFFLKDTVLLNYPSPDVCLGMQNAAKKISCYHNLKEIHLIKACIK